MTGETLAINGDSVAMAGVSLAMIGENLATASESLAMHSVFLAICPLNPAIIDLLLKENNYCGRINHLLEKVNSSFLTKKSIQ